MRRIVLTFVLLLSAGTTIRAQDRTVNKLPNNLEVGFSVFANNQYSDGVVTNLYIERHFSTKYDNIKWIVGGMMFRQDAGVDGGGIYGGIGIRSTGRILALTSAFCIGVFPMHYKGELDSYSQLYSVPPISSIAGGTMSAGIFIRLGKYIAIHPQVTILLAGGSQAKRGFLMEGIKLPLTITF